METAAAMEEALAKSLRAPAPADQLHWMEQDHQERPDEPGALRAKLAGFSLHAGTWVPAEDREALERLCRYGLRGPFSQERLSRRVDGQIVYSLRRPWPNSGGVTRLVMDPLDFLRRLAALVPPPGFHTQLLYRVFFVDALLCARCGGRMTVIAFLSDPVIVRRVLEHLEISATPPSVWPARTDPSCLWPPRDDAADEEPWTDAAFGRDAGRSPP